LEFRPNRCLIYTGCGLTPIKNIVIGFSKPSSFSLHAWIIEKIDEASFDHAYLRFHSDSLNRDVIYQANWRGVQFVGASIFSQTTTPVKEYLLTVDDSEYTSMMQFCMDNAGISYGYLAVIGDGLVDIMARLGKKIENPFSDGAKTEFCSEIVARCLNVVDPAQFQLSADNISPNDLDQILQKLQIKRIL